MITRIAVAMGLGLALGLTCADALAQEHTVLPEERKGDPSPDTQTASDLLKRGRYEDAIRQAKLALGRDERYVPAMIVLAKSYYGLRKYELATSIVDIAKSVDPNCAECYNLLGFVALTRDAGAPDRISATAAFKKATEIKSDYGVAWTNLAAQYLISKNYDGAVDAAEHAVRSTPQSAKAYLNLGSAYRGKQRYADAEKALKHVIELESSNADAYFNLGILFLDAKEMPGMDLQQKLNQSITYLSRYKQLSGYKLAKDDPADTYVGEARQGIEREQKRLERMRKQAERAQPKPATPAPQKAGGSDK